MGDSSRQSAKTQLSTPVQFLPGVGPQRAKLLARLQLRTARDVVFFFPRDYEDAARMRLVHELDETEPASLAGVVEEIELRNTSPGRNVLGVLVRQGSQYVRAVWFDQPFMQRRLRRGQNVVLTGTPRRNGLRWEFVHPKVFSQGSEDVTPRGEIMPIYRLTEGLKQHQLGRLVKNVVESCADSIEEVLPAAFREPHGLWPISRALRQIHNPTSREDLGRAQRRFVFQELLVLQLGLALRRSLTRSLGAVPLPNSPRIAARIRRLFDFQLTRGQEKVIGEIAADMAGESPMNRLLQGDVGSGKTVVAIFAMLVAVVHKCQAALMVPNEILAQQHFQNLSRALANAKVRVGLLTGALSSTQRRQTLADIQAGNVDLVVGTQSVIQEGVTFAKLGLVVIDEQHKFGVQQRARLRAAGLQPHYLVMTATPIPRTIAMTEFGDLDVSVLNDCPPGRQPLHTYLGDEPQRDKWWEFFRRKLREGRQGYVITPLVDQRDDAEVTSLNESFESLCNGELEAFRLGLVHGGLSASDKHAAMDGFRRAELQVLVATSVVEVGVDVPNASVMTIENGERFGLAQLHQMRGRVGRGSHPGYVCVFSDVKTEEARQRLKAFEQTTDGFELAEIDFRLRGPGNLLGTRQHGLPPLRIANLTRDEETLREVREAAADIVSRDSHLRGPEWAKLLHQINVRYGAALNLGDVG